MLVNGKHYRTVWREGSAVRMIDQTLLPFRFQVFDSADHRESARAIRDMVTRGAGAIGAAAGFGVAQAALEAPAVSTFRAYMEAAAALLRGSRPTAQNLFYAVDRVMAAALAALPDIAGARAAACAAADALADEDVEAGRLIGEAGAASDPRRRAGAHALQRRLACLHRLGNRALSHLPATREGRRVFVWVDETRPRLQGARLTAWELAGEGIDFRVIPDNAAGYFMRRGEVDLVIVGADRIAANGDVANKIGTYEKAVLARESGVPFYVAAPLSTIDLDCPDGDSIPIEERGEDEVLSATGPDAPADARRLRSGPYAWQAPVRAARNPAFDVTPRRFVAGHHHGEGGRGSRGSGSAAGGRRVIRPATVPPLRRHPRAAPSPREERRDLLLVDLGDNVAFHGLLRAELHAHLEVLREQLEAEHPLELAEAALGVHPRLLISSEMSSMICGLSSRSSLWMRNRSPAPRRTSPAPPRWAPRARRGTSGPGPPP